MCPLTGQAGVAKDKFLIMFMAVEPEVAVSQVNELFKVTSRENYSEHRSVLFVGLSPTLYKRICCIAKIALHPHTNVLISDFLENCHTVIMYSQMSSLP